VDLGTTKRPIQTHLNITFIEFAGGLALWVRIIGKLRLKQVDFECGIVVCCCASAKPNIVSSWN